MTAVETMGLPWQRPRHELVLLALVAVAALLPVYEVNPQDQSRICLAQAALHGHLFNDACLSTSIDRSVYRGHLYSDKAPGMSALELPGVELVPTKPLQLIGGENLGLWGIRLLSSGIAFLLAAFLVGRIGEGLSPGRGGAVLVVFALGTLVAPLAATSFSHVATGAAGLAAFAFAWRGRSLLAGLLAGVTLLLEYQSLAIVAILALYVAFRNRRAVAAYGVGLVPAVGVLLAYNAAAFGAPWHFSYRYVTSEFATEQSSGFFGIHAPHLHSVYEVFVGNEGLLVASPVLVAAGWGLVRLARTHLAEAVVCAAVAVFYVLLNTGYYLPYGGGSPGPRFLAPALPFVAVGLGPAFRWRPRLTTALGVASVIATIALTLAWSRGTPRQTIWGELARVFVEGRWSRFVEHLMPKTALNWVGVGHGGAFVAAAGAAALLVALVRRPTSLRASVRRHPWRASAAAVAVLACGAGAVKLALLPLGLDTSISGTRSAVYANSEIDFIVTLTNTTQSGFDALRLVVDLPRGVDLLGAPAYDRGSGCRGTSTVNCDIGYLGPGAATSIRFGTKITADAFPAVTIRAWGVSADRVGPKAAFTVTIEP